jgi:hypothetical protein
LAEEKAKDEQEGKRWHYHSNSDVDLWSLVTGKAGKSRRDTPDISQNESDNE